MSQESMEFDGIPTGNMGATERRKIRKALKRLMGEGKLRQYEESVRLSGIREEYSALMKLGVPYGVTPIPSTDILLVVSPVGKPETKAVWPLSVLLNEILQFIDCSDDADVLMQIFNEYNVKAGKRWDELRTKEREK